MNQNPWVTTPSIGQVMATPSAETPEDLAVAPLWVGVGAPQPGIPVPDRVDRLGRVSVPLGSVLVVGVHGGSGESTLARWLGCRSTGHRWPVIEASTPRVLLCARTTAQGIAAARMAAREWASGEAAVDLLGLVLIEDAPGRLPKQLRREAKHASGGVPRTWLVPYSRPLRLGRTTGDEPPMEVRPVLNSIAQHLNPGKKES